MVPNPFFTPKPGRGPCHLPQAVPPFLPRSSKQQNITLRHRDDSCSGVPQEASTNFTSGVSSVAWDINPIVLTMPSAHHSLFVNHTLRSARETAPS